MQSLLQIMFQNFFLSPNSNLRSRWHLINSFHTGNDIFTVLCTPFKVLLENRMFPSFDVNVFCHIAES